MLQKFEADVRQHIRIEQQLKLHIESIQEELERWERQIEDHQEEKDRFAREKARMDEMLTIRENEISKLENQVKTLKNTVRDRDNKIKDVQGSLDEAKLKIEEQKFALEHERKLYTKFHILNDGKTYSRSNGRRDRSGSNTNETKAMPNVIPQTNVPKKPASRMYASLYNSNQTKAKTNSNAHDSKSYEKLYKDFMKNKKYENPKQIMEDHRSNIFSNSGVMSSSCINNIKQSDVRNGSIKKCKKYKHIKESGRKHYSKNVQRKGNIDLSKSKERKFENKIDFYPKVSSNFHWICFKSRLKDHAKPLIYFEGYLNIFRIYATVYLSE